MDLKVHLKPSKQVVSGTAFDKGKLFLVPLCQRVLFSFKIDRIQDVRLSVKVAGSDAVFWLVPMGNAPKEDNAISPFWFMSSHDQDHNMDIHMIKIDDFKLPVARNIKTIKAGDTLVMYKPKRVAHVEPLVTPEPSTSSIVKSKAKANPDGARKKARTT